MKPRRKPKPAPADSIKIVDRPTTYAIELYPVENEVLARLARAMNAMPEDILRAGWYLALTYAMNQAGPTPFQKWRAILWDVRGDVHPHSEALAAVCPLVDWNWLNNGGYRLVPVPGARPMPAVEDDDPGEGWKAS